MNRRSLGTASVSVTMARIATHRDDLSHLACMSCGVGLELHQADPDLTERLLGVCARCQHWYILDLVPDEDEAVMVLVPEAGLFVRLGDPKGRQGRRQLPSEKAGNPGGR